MKKLFAIIITAAILVACSNEEPKEPVESTKPVEETAPAEQGSEVEEGLKADTVEQQYSAFASDEVSINSKVKFVGTVSAVNDGTFEVQSEANGSSEKIVRVNDIRLGERRDILEGSEVSVYGTYNGKDEDEVPVIKGIFIDAK